MRRLTPAVLASLVLQAACTPSGMPSGTPSGTSSHTNRQDFPTYSVSIPPTWTRTDYGPDSLHKGLYGFTWSGVRFEGPDGEYVDISPDLPTDLQGADSWLGAKIGSAGEVMTIGDNRLCGKRPANPTCRAAGSA